MLADEVCDAGCGRALRAYYEAVTAACQGQNFTVPAGVTFPERAGGTIWTAYNETCLKDPATDEYYTDVINTFTPVDTEMPRDELCSPCYISLHTMMQSSPYSVYHDPLLSDYLQARPEYIYSQCDIDQGPSEIKDPQYIPVEEEPIPCFTDVTYTTKDGDTWYSIALSCTGLLQVGITYCVAPTWVWQDVGMID